jgi:hypothetical protein
LEGEASHSLGELRKRAVESGDYGKGSIYQRVKEFAGVGC